MASAPAIITYQKPGTKPPVYVGGTFSDPAWQLEEMDYHVDQDGEHVFQKEVQGEPGSKIHYKFRIGNGDWWVLNDDTPTVTDHAGNKNNELEVAHPKDPSDKQTASNGDATAPKPAEAGEGDPKPVINAAKEMLSRSDARSGASTPAFARTAAEVADSAALLNEEESEPDISDAEAGRIGFRRMSGTPISQVAATAAEVADTAQELDKPEVPEVVIQNYQREDYDLPGDEPDDDFRPPLFAHECIGMYNGEEIAAPEHEETEEYDHAKRGSVEEVDLDHIDINDPTLERFPSNREGIMDTVRKLETGLGEDRVAFEGAPLSPVIGKYRPGMEDITGDPFLTSPIGASPIIPRPAKHLEVPRSPHGSISSNHSSPLSLQAIDEGEEPSDTEDEHAPLLSPPQSRTGVRSGKQPSSSEDEGVSMQDNDPSKPESPRDKISRALQDESPDIEATSHASEQRHSPKTSESLPDASQRHSPQILIQPVEDNTYHKVTINGNEDGDLAKPGQATTAPDTTNRETTDVGTSSAVEASEGNQVRKRAEPIARPGTPSSIHSVGMRPGVDGGWFRNFFRLLFVDWIGGFISRLCGGRRQTLLTAGAAAIFMGFSWYQIYGIDGR